MSACKLAFVGFDTGTIRLGYAAITEQAIILDSGVWKFSSKLPLEQRLILIAQAVDLFVPDVEGTYVVVSVGIEDPWLGANAQTALKLGKVWGVIFETLSFYAPVGIAATEAKKALTGNGRATKDDMVKHALVQFGLEAEEDEADALGVALATLAKWKERQHG